MANKDESIRELVLKLWRGAEYERVAQLKGAVLTSCRDDDEVVCALSLALSMPDIGESDDAIRILKDALSDRGRSHTLLKALVECCLLAGDYAQGFEAAKGAIELYPRDSHLHSLLGTIIATGTGVAATLEDAAEAFERAIGLDPNNCELYRSLGVTRWKGNHLNAAKEALEACLERIPHEEQQSREKLRQWLIAISQGKSYWEANIVDPAQ